MDAPAATRKNAPSPLRSNLARARTSRARQNRPRENQRRSRESRHPSLEVSRQAATKARATSAGSVEVSRLLIRQDGSAGGGQSEGKAGEALEAGGHEREVGVCEDGVGAV